MRTKRQDMLIGDDPLKTKDGRQRAPTETGAGIGATRRAAITVVVGSIVLAACGAPVEIPAVQADAASVNTLDRIERLTPAAVTARASTYFSLPEMFPEPPEPAFGEEPRTGPR